MKDLKMILSDYHDHQRRVRMHPPFTCPFCGLDRIVNITKVKTEYHVWCQKGCFDKTVLAPRNACNKIDAFNKVIDLVRRERNDT